MDSEGSENHGLFKSFDPGNIICTHFFQFQEVQAKGYRMKHIYGKDDTIPQ